MAAPTKRAWLGTAVQVAAAGLGAVVAGPVGGAVAGLVGASVLGPAAEETLRHLTEKFGEKATEKLLETGADSLAERLKEQAGSLQDAYREALAAALEALPERVKAGYEEWFAHWRRALEGGVPLRLSAAQPEQLAQQNFGTFFAHILEMLDAQGTALEGKGLSLQLNTRALPAPLLADLLQSLPELLDRSFRALIVKAEYEEGWKEAQSALQEQAAKVMRALEERTQHIERNTDLLPGMAERMDAGFSAIGARMDSADMMGRDLIEFQRAEIARLKKIEAELQAALARRSEDAASVEISKRLEAKDVAGALAIKDRVARERGHQLAEDFFELATMHELNFDWAQALENYKKAWEQEKNPEFGLRYAFIAARQRKYAEAAATYNELKSLCKDPANVAEIHANLGNVYLTTQEFPAARDAYEKALNIFRELAEIRPDVYQGYVAGLLANLGELYSQLAMAKESEESFDAAFKLLVELAGADPGTHLANLSNTCNLAGKFYDSAGRLREAEQFYLAALYLRRRLAKEDRQRYISDAADTLNNLCIVHRKTGRYKESEEEFKRAEVIWRELVRSAPEVWLPNFAALLNSGGNLYTETDRQEDAERAFSEAYDICTVTAQANPSAFLPALAGTAYNLAEVEVELRRLDKAEGHYVEAVQKYGELAAKLPEQYRPPLGHVSYRAAKMYFDAGMRKDARFFCDGARKSLELPWTRDPNKYGNWMARIVLLAARLDRADGVEEATVARDLLLARAMARSGELRAEIQAELNAVMAGRLPEGGG